MTRILNGFLQVPWVFGRLLADQRDDHPHHLQPESSVSSANLDPQIQGSGKEFPHLRYDHRVKSREPVVIWHLPLWMLLHKT